MPEAEAKSDGAAARRESFAALLREWREILSRAVEEAEEFTRQRPAAGLAASFVAGFVFGGIFRRR